MNGSCSRGMTFGPVRPSFQCTRKGKIKNVCFVVWNAVIALANGTDQLASQTVPLPAWVVMRRSGLSSSLSFHISHEVTCLTSVSNKSGRTHASMFVDSLIVITASSVAWRGTSTKGWVTWRQNKNNNFLNAERENRRHPRGSENQTKKNELAPDGDRTHGLRISAPTL